MHISLGSSLTSTSCLTLATHRALCAVLCYACSRALGSSERLHLPPELWVQTLRELLVPVVTGGWVGGSLAALWAQRSARTARRALFHQEHRSGKSR